MMSYGTPLFQSRGTDARLDQLDRSYHFLTPFLLTLFILGIISSPGARAQSLPPGTSDDQIGEGAYQSYHGGDIDSISLTNGTLTLNFPFLSYPQRGKLHLDFNLMYNNQSQHTGEFCVPGISPPKCYWLWNWPQAAAGELPVERSDVYVGYAQQFSGYGQYLSTQITDGKIVEDTIFYSNWSLQFADGSKHPLANMGAFTWYTNATWCGASGVSGNTQCSVADGPLETLDATGWRVNGSMNPCLNSNGGSCAGLSPQNTVVDPNGVIYSGLTQQDPNGNEITSSSGELIDSLGRQIPLPPTASSTGNASASNCPVISGQPSAGTAVLWTPPGYNSASQQYIFCYASFPQVLPPTTGWTDCSSYPSAVTRLQSIVLPNGQNWQFQYNDPDPTTNCLGTTSQFATLSQITLPTGGTISYTYTYGGGAACQNAGRFVLTRTVNANDGTGFHTWTYTYNSGNTVVTDPLGNDVVHTFGVGGNCVAYETETQYYQGSHTSGTLLKTVNTTWSYSTASRDTWPLRPINAVPTSVQTVWPNGQTDEVVKAYDSGYSYTDWQGSSTDLNGNPNVGIYGKEIQEQAYDYPSGTSLLRTTNTSYAWQTGANASSYLANNLLDLPYSVQILNGSGTQMAYTYYGYDESSLVSSGITEQHVAGESYPGNQTSVHRLQTGTTTATTNCNVSVSNGYLTSTKLYYDTGEVQQSSDPCGNATTYGYSSTYYGAFPTTVTNALSQTTTYGYDFDMGVVTSITDPNSQTTTKSYDMLARLTSVSYPDKGSTTYCYSDTLSSLGGTCASGPPFQVIETKVLSSTINEVNTVVVDGLGRLSQTQLNSDPNGATYTLTTYDANGRKSQVYNPTRCSTITTNCKSESTWGLITNNYDALGRVTSVVEQDGSAVSTSYGTTPPSGYSGYCTTVTDEAGNSRQSCVDGLGRMRIVVEAPGSLNYLTTYAYDALGNLTGVTQNGSNSSSARTRSFTYDSLSELMSATNPESGTITYTYDADGNAITKTALAPNQASTGTKTVVTTYTYDKLNRLTGKSYADSYNSYVTPAVSYGYDGNAPSGCTPPTVTAPTNSGIPTSPTNTIGRRSSMCDGSGATAWIYDPMGRPSIEERTLNGVTKNIGYFYYLGGQLQYLWYASDNRMNFNVTAAGRIDGETDELDNYVADNASFTPSGAVTGMSQYSRTSSYSVGLSSNFLYNSRLQHALEYSAYTGSSGGVYLYQRCYDYHLNGGLNLSFGGVTCSFSGTSPGDNGNVYQITNNLNGARSQVFSYDSLNRITQAYNGGATWGQQFNIDAWGNLYSVTAISGYPVIGGFTATATSSNQLSCTSGCTTSYDAAGNTTTTGNGAITYDDENRILIANGVIYTYDGDGKRVEKSTGTLYWTGVGSEPLSESTLTGTINEEYVFFNGMRVSKIDRPSNTVHAFLADHLGSSRMSVVASGTNTLTVEEDLDYTPYGIVASGTATDHYQFNGKEYDSESGLNNFGARYDAALLGRFMTPDWEAKPVTVPYAKFGDPQTLNLYSFVENGPINRIDPDGHDDEAPASGGNSGDNSGGQASTKTVQPPPPPPPPPPPSAQNTTVTVTVDQVKSANPYGHAVVQVDGGQKVGLVPDSDKAAAAAVVKEAASAAAGHPTPDPVPGHVEPLAANRTKDIKDTAVLHVTPDQAKKMQATINDSIKNLHSYDPGYHNCANFVEDVLRSGGVRAPYDMTPGGLVEDLKQNPNPQ